MGGVVRRKRKPTAATITPDQLGALVTQYLSAKRMADDVSTKAESIKKELKAYVESNGVADSDQHRWIDLPEEVEGKARLKLERRVAQSLDEDAAEELLKEKGILKKCQTKIVVLDEEKILNAYHDGELTEDELDAIYKVRETFAFKVL